MKAGHTSIPFLIAILVVSVLALHVSLRSTGYLKPIASPQVLSESSNRDDRLEYEDEPLDPPLNSNLPAIKNSELGEFENQGMEEENENESEVEIENENDQDVFKDATAGAMSNFPLSINPETKQLTVTTPAGAKKVAILPGHAIENLMSHNPKIKIEPVSSQSAAFLEDQKGELVYHFRGNVRKMLFGLLPISIPTTAFVSSETGQVTSQPTSLLAQLLNLLSQ